KADTPELANARLIKRLEIYADDRVKVDLAPTISGLKMKEWRRVANGWKLARERNGIIDREAAQEGQSSTSDAPTRQVGSPAINKGRSNRPLSIEIVKMTLAGVEATIVSDDATKDRLRERLLSLPVEIFGQICSFLDALELRHLSLVDATFWSILVSAKSDRIWRQGFKLVVPPVPECPETMAASDYARFMLVEACTKACPAKPWSVCTEYFHRVRYCHKCIKVNIISQEMILESYPDFPLEFLKYLSSEAVASDGSSLAGSSGGSQEPKRLYHKVTVAYAYSLWKSLSEKADTPELANARLIERLEKYADDHIKSGLKMKEWRRAASERKYAREWNIRSDREAAISAKLLELGYQEIDFPRQCYELYLPGPLTNQ
ncbi:hypothetical protein FRC01_013893, partial [Tulasnella sp. 417]